jgi:tripartite ATP-independent transporter DctM subunit
MIRQGYEPRMAAGVVAISGTLAMLLPTSVALIVYGLLAEVSIAKLMIAGIVPAMVVMATIIGTVWFLVRLDPTRAPIVGRVPWGEKFRLLSRVGPMLALFTLVTGSIFAGLATPTEASAVGAFGSLGLALWRTRPKGGQLLQSFQRAAAGSCMILLILVGAAIFSYAFTLTQVTQDLVHWVGTLGVSRWIIIIIILAGYVVLGSFMDQLAILVLTVPVVLPLIKSLGFDPVWFGIIKIVTAEVGMITPPVGLNCFVVARYANRPVTEVFSGTMPHFAAHLLAIALLVAFPSLVLWLPSRM